MGPPKENKSATVHGGIFGEVSRKESHHDDEERQDGPKK